MNRDLEETLNELGPDYRAVVARLKGETNDGQKTKDRGQRPLSSVLCPLSFLVAASLLVVVGFAVVFNRQPQTESQQSSVYGAREYRQSVGDMIASQNPDGSWQNDFLTRRNAGILRESSDPAARIAYKKAMRNLRTRGVL